ncbi:MAG: phosphatidylglycerophosphate synthase [Alphaproteobacteria bacterium]|nr:phosphatidylglycerophosphate synthase [Alphaproteobacteria bacterium]
MISRPLEVVLVGENPTRLWGISVDERIRRIAAAQKLVIGEEAVGDGPALLVDRSFVFDPAWLRHIAAHSGEALTHGGRIALAHGRNAEERRQAAAAMAAGAAPDAATTLALRRHEEGGARLNAELRKREQPFLMVLDRSSVRAAERASYFGAYKGVTDLLTKYLWPEWALVLTRLAARLGISPNAVTALGALLCVVTTILFWHGDYWIGMATALGFMVLDTVDGKLARCTITSSKWGNIFDHGIDLIHPPFWWYAWGIGLVAYGRPLDPRTFAAAMAVVILGYVAQRLVEGAFLRLYGMHIHVWHKVDSDFRLVTARRNPNMVILFVSLLLGRPDAGLIAVAGWTLLSCLFHLVRLVQAMRIRASGGEIRSWLA